MEKFVFDRDTKQYHSKSGSDHYSLSVGDRIVAYSDDSTYDKTLRTFSTFEKVFYDEKGDIIFKGKKDGENMERPEQLEVLARAFKKDNNLFPTQKPKVVARLLLEAILEGDYQTEFWD